MKKLHTKLSLIGLLFSAMLLSGAFSLPTTALANGTCLGGDGTGTLTWDNTTCPLSTGVGQVYVYDITVGGWRISNSNFDSTSRFNTRINTNTNISSWINTNASYSGTAMQTTDQFAYLYGQNAACTTTAATYTVCAAALGSEQYPNVTNNGSTWDLHAGPTTFTLTYTAGAHGSITGTSPQTVNSGASGTQVTAVPNAGYHFTSWSDASTSAARTDSNVTADHTFTASFAANPPCSWGCGGIPTAYTAHFSTSTQQASAIGALGDLSSFAFGVIPKVLAILLALIALGVGIWLLKRWISGGAGWDGPANGLGDGLTRGELGDTWGIVDTKTNQLAASGKRDTYL